MPDPSTRRSPRSAGPGATRRRGLRLALALALVLAAGVAAAAAWAISDRYGADNDFCNSCHLPDGTALHRALRDDFDRLIPVDLGGFHGRGLLDEREDQAFRCMDCHAGVGLVERTQVKLLAAKDAVRYLVGSFEEPDGMPVPLSDAVCLRCHERLRGAAAPGWDRESFHGIAAHTPSDRVLCVDCHAIHERAGDAIAYFLERERVHAGCRRCHRNLGAILARDP